MNISIKKTSPCKVCFLSQRPMSSYGILFSLILLGFGFSTKAETPRIYTSKLQKVTVYIQGAHLYYSETINLQPGTTDVIFENISPTINPASLQASSKGGMVMDIKHNLKYKEKVIVTKKYDAELDKVLDSLEEIGYLLQEIDYKNIVLTTEKTMLLSNRIIKGQPLRDSLALLRDGMLFLKEKLNSIYEQELKLKRSKDKLNKLKDKLNARHNYLTLLQSGQENNLLSTAQPVNQVIITLFSETATTTQVTFNYLITNASWVPVYDLQANSSTKMFQLKYFANVAQYSGLDWNNVPLTLSTSNPSENNTKPDLNPWYVSFVEFMRRNERSDNLSNARIPMQAETATFSKDDEKEMAEDEESKKYLDQYVEVTENIIRTEYEIKLNYTITADGKNHKVLINQKDIPMEMQFAAVPKICSDAFLMAKVSGWEDINIIPGTARVYFDGGYVGEMYLNASSTTDTLSINLGRDKSISLTRKKIKEKYKEKILNDDKIETRTIEVVVHNTKGIPIDILIEDQIPVVRGTDQIKVVLLKNDGAEWDEATGRLKWNLKLKVKETKKLVFTYEIRYPKGKVLAGL